MVILIAVWIVLVLSLKFTKILGINIPAYTVDMESYGHQISRSEVQAGDMGFYGNHGASYHITLALDNKRMIYEPAPGQSCMEQNIDAYPPTWVGKKRPNGGNRRRQLKERRD